jgi:hypothetical protein
LDNNINKLEFKVGGWIGKTYQVLTSQRARIVLAGFLAISLAGGTVFGIQYYTNQDFKNYVDGVRSGGLSRVAVDNRISAGELKERLKGLTIGDALFSDIQVGQLPVYPNSWVERNFTEEERKNPLISGPDADPAKSGLTNREKFFFGANPKLRDSLCKDRVDGKPFVEGSNIICDGNNKDIDYIRAGISPLTGSNLEIQPSLRIMKQDLSILDSVKDGFEASSREGVDLPVLYQRSKLPEIDGPTQIESDNIKVNEVEENPVSVSNYLQKRIEVLSSDFESSEVNALAQIYQSTTPEQLQSIKQRYQKLLEKIAVIPTPKMYKKQQQAYTLIFQKLIELIDFRANALKENKLDTEENKAKSLDIATRVAWGYRKVVEEGEKTNNN